MTPKPPPCLGPENDYRAVAAREPHGQPTATVVVPTYNGSEELARTLAGLASQTLTPGRFDVVVADDGSEEDIARVAAGFGEVLDVEVVRQPRDGFGLARARNLGASGAEGDVLVFLDSDCIPIPDFLERHLWWHARAGNLVVAGSRRHLDAAALTVEGIQSGATDLEELAATEEDPPDGPLPPADWRRVFYRRNKALLISDAAFRAGVGSNVSVCRDRFEAIGGFSAAFRAWGGEDTECMWRLWNSGMFVVPENRALVLHQIQRDADGTWREGARRRALALVADLVPHPFYRKEVTPLATVPRVSWVVAVGDDEEARRWWREASLATYTDTELIMWGPPAAVDEFASQGATAAKVGVVPGDDPAAFAAAVKAARGELIAFADGRAEIPRWLLARAVGRFDRQPRTAAVRVGYEIGDDRYLRQADLSAVEGTIGRHGLPLFALTRRREILKDDDSIGEPARAWSAVLRRGRVELIINDLARLPDSGTVLSPGRLGIGDVAAAGAEELARAAVRKLRALRSDADPAAASEPPPAEQRVGVDYIGFTGKNNLGDEAILRAVQHLMPWARIERDLEGAAVLMVGGGTLVNGRNYYLTRLLRRDSPTLEKVVFGVGVRSPGFWGVTEPMEEWWSLFDAALYVGVRGPDSVAYLRELGYAGDVEILGDPALSLRPPEGVAAVEGRVVVCPVWTGGLIHGDDDAAVFDALATTIRMLRAEGREVVMLSAFPEDDRHLLELMRQAGQPDMPYVAGYADVDETLRLLASAELVIAERLHAAILAAACGTPFVALEYRPKLRDFARSVGMEDYVVRADAVGDGQLDRAVRRVLAAGEEIGAELERNVAGRRQHQETVAAELGRQLEATR